MICKLLKALHRDDYSINIRVSELEQQFIGIDAVNSKYYGNGWHDNGDMMIRGARTNVEVDRYFAITCIGDALTTAIVDRDGHTILDTAPFLEVILDVMSHLLA